MNRVEILKRSKAYAKKNNLTYAFDPRHGKGSHGRETVGEKFTTVKKSEFGPGLYRKMLTDLGIDKEAF